MRHAAARQGRSQQQIAIEAIEIALGLALPPRDRKPPLPEPGVPYQRDIGPRVPLPSGVTSSLELLDREDRF